MCNISSAEALLSGSKTSIFSKISKAFSLFISGKASLKLFLLNLLKPSPVSPAFHSGDSFNQGYLVSSGVPIILNICLH